MCAPAGPPRLPGLLSATTALALLVPLPAVAAETGTEAKRALHSSLPRYDPAAYEKAQAEKAARVAPKNTPAPLPESKPVAPVAPASAAPREHVLELPKVTVRATTETIKRLPRIDTIKPVEVEQVDPMESETGRDARLVRKHLSKLEQVLNRFPRFFGVSAIAQAREAESIEQNIAQMNELAAGIELQAAFGRDPEEIKKLRAEYIKLYYSGPKH